ncbi:MAG: hypothetical protein GC206_13610 [Alphaproteobacteria bacterium]|nr:hypothetical protein [Alphaproteobacteria bacterium]
MRGSVWASDEAIAAFSLKELNDEIEHASWRLRHAKRADHRKSYFGRLVMLETVREARFGLAAPRRVLRARRR